MEQEYINKFKNMRQAGRLVTQAEAARRIGKGIWIISDAVNDGRLTAWPNPEPQYQRQGATLVDIQEVGERWPIVNSGQVEPVAWRGVQNKLTQTHQRECEQSVTLCGLSIPEETELLAESKGPCRQCGLYSVYEYDITE
jgi:hypothetical protein